MAGKILTGTASWTDPGFVAGSVPPGLPAAQRLTWYAEHFPLVEVNSTFYRLPERASVKRWCAETPRDFLFDLKLHKFLSRHSTKPEMLPPVLRANAEVEKGRTKLTPQLEKAVARLFLKNLEPFKEAGKLGALMLQLSPAFSPRHNKLSELDNLLGLLDGYEVAIELRNRSWISPELLDETRKFFHTRSLTFVMVDAPDDPHFTIMPNIDLITNKRLSYFRAHGRNAQGYVRGRTVATRFEHQYSEPELKEIAARAVAAAAKSRAVHVIYNNNAADYAPRAAASFKAYYPRYQPENRTSEELLHA